MSCSLSTRTRDSFRHGTKVFLLYEIYICIYIWQIVIYDICTTFSSVTGLVSSFLLIYRYIPIYLMTALVFSYILLRLHAVIVL